MIRSFNFCTSTQVAFSSFDSKQENLKAIMTRKKLYKLMWQFNKRQNIG